MPSSPIASACFNDVDDSLLGVLRKVSDPRDPRGVRYPLPGMLAVAVCAVVLFSMAMPATWKYVTFMKVESTSYLNIRFDLLYSVYLVFAAAIVVRYLWAIFTLLRGDAPEAVDITKASSGL